MKNAMKFCLTLLASLLFIGAANTLQAQEDGVASEIDNFVAKWQEDYNKADVDGLLSHYSEDAIQIRETGEELKGADAIAANYKAFFDGMTAKADIKVGEVYKVADDVVLVSGTYELSGSNKKSGEEFASSGTYSTLAKKNGDEWVIERHMVAVPVKTAETQKSDAKE
ncbi:MAG: SgcJ/EcaC family oxidoreductase [Saprospiraceae bacterium]|nr:SgcJ/EcaC family oxidoreductase [Saprospiraceae bacterium]MCB0676117.1 SgcJ/EcaC family oxidoreductase [Saprospiraceae bacterium]MCB0681182.1 SgcJ/EcaC family oxidoreductase [Saprospiraceae bacterium]